MIQDRWLLLLLWLLLNQKLGAARTDPRPTILLVDVDNTLYCETNHGIERQIINNIHHFCKKRLKIMTQADELHAKYGSTVEGLRQTLWKDLSKEKQEENMRDFYDFVYKNIRKQSLLASGADNSGSNTGYTHNDDVLEQTRQQRLRRILQASPFPIHLASNSPLHHISEIVHVMGLCDVLDRPSLTPDSHRDRQDVKFPTKMQPSAFFSPILSSLDKDTIILLDDSHTTISACSPHNITGVLINNSQDDNKIGTSLETALAHAYGWFDPEYTFSDVDYLRAKNKVDFASLNREAWRRVGQELKEMAIRSGQPVQIVDIGAGVLSMLRLVVFGNDDDMPSLGDMFKAPVAIDYYAYEPNEQLWTACISELESLGFKMVDQNTSDGVKNAVFEFSAQDEKIHVKVHLRCCDYRLANHSPDICPQLIVGCCFADLMDPRVLVASLMKCFLLESGNDTTNDFCIAYFPITFCGITQCLPPQPFETGRAGRMIPSDTTVFSHYANVLKDHHGHNLDISLLDASMKAYGAECLFRGRSNWLIDPHRDDYLWKTMLFFFSSVAAIDLEEQGIWDFQGWISRTRKVMPQIRVSNLDLVYRLPRLGRWQLGSFSGTAAKSSKLHNQNTYEEIQFIGPEKVTSRKKKVTKLQGEQVRIQSIASLISTGTELKIYHGNFDDAALDVNIKAMDDANMAYPLSYGYCLVGRVVECGPDVKDAENLVGKKVFAFSPHASQAVVDYSVVQLVPEDIDPYDAIFMPSVETAVSLIHEAHPRLGDQIGVFGQGLIGLLVTCLLSEQGYNRISGRFGTVSTFDLIPDRLALSALMGASQALMPDEASATGPFDVSIEVSGNPRALQSAVDCTRDGGKIVIGSWYGNKEISLRLGIDFHRSHKELKASQVSSIPQGMQMTWSKDRRFNLTWDLVRKIRPSRLLTKRMTLADCKEAYAALSDGREVAIAFTYSEVNTRL